MKTYYDLDGTLSDLNSTYDFIYGFLRANKKTKLIFGKILDYILQNLFFIPMKYKRKWLINFLFINLKVKELETYYESTYKKDFLKSLTKLGKKVKKEKKKSTLLTGCTEIPAKKIGKIFGCNEIISTEFRIENGTIKGISKDTYGDYKAKYVTEKGIYYTDEPTVETALIPLMEKIVVVGNQESQKSLFIPFYYSIKREMNRFKMPVSASIIRFIANYSYDYLWIPLYAIYFLGIPSNISTYINLILAIAGFIITYETGYIISDHIGILFEKKELKHNVFSNKVGLMKSFQAIFIRLIVIGVILFFNSYTTYLFIGFLLTIKVFILHALLKEKYRSGTFIALRILKGYVPFIPVLSTIGFTNNLLVIGALTGISFYYSLEYVPRKLGYENTIDISDEKNSPLRFFCMLLYSGIIFVATTATLAQYLLVILFYSLNNILFFTLIHLRNSIMKEK